MKNTPIIAKFLLVMAIFGLFAVGMAVFSASKIDEVATGYSDSIAHESKSALSLSRSATRLALMRASIAELELSVTAEGNATATAGLHQARADFSSSMEDAAATNAKSSSDILALKQKALQLVDATCSASIKAGASAETPETVAASQALYLKECASGFAALTSELTAQSVAAREIVTHRSEALKDLTKQTVIITYALILGGVALVMAFGFFVVRTWISKPLVALAGLMGRLSSGDLTAVVDGTERKDEVGAMSRAVQLFKDAGLEKTRLERQSEADRAAAEEGRARGEQERQIIADQQAAVVRSLADGLGRLSAGDLTCDMTEAFAPEYERLRTDFNAAVVELRGVISTIIANTGAIRSGTGEISQAADDLSRRTEQQAASLEETAAALDQITATVRKTAEGATAAQTVVASTKSEAAHGEGVVREAVTAMTEIEKSASEISQIIGVIDEIAFQTNLLALNAGVEAARAGDAGRGFAVVASEVRALAQRSAEAAKEIKALISTSTSHVGRGVTLVQQTGTALSRILGQVTQMDVAMNEIAASAQEQATGLGQVNTAVNQMDQVTQQNAAMVEQSTAASHSLAQDAAELERLTARFNTGAVAAAPPVEVRKAPAKARASHASPARKSVVDVAGHTARKAAPDQDGWKEF